MRRYRGTKMRAILWFHNGFFGNIAPLVMMSANSFVKQWSMLGLPVGSAKDKDQIKGSCTHD